MFTILKPIKESEISDSSRQTPCRQREKYMLPPFPPKQDPASKRYSKNTDGIKRQSSRYCGQTNLSGGEVRKILACENTGTLTLANSEKKARALSAVDERSEAKKSTKLPVPMQCQNNETPRKDKRKRQNIRSNVRKSPQNSFSQIKKSKSSPVQACTAERLAIQHQFKNKSNVITKAKIMSMITPEPSW